MKRSIHCFILITSVMLAACSQNKIVNNSIVINPKSEVFSIEKCDILSDMELVQLETNDSVLIANIDEVVVASDRLFIADFENGVVYIFNLDGKYVNKISDQGRGANEYLYLFDIFYDLESNTINLLSRNTSKVLRYSNDGELISVHPLPLEAIQMEYLNGHYYATTGYYSQESCSGNNLVILDTAFQVINSMCAIDEIGVNNALYDNLFTYNGYIYYVDNWLYNVFNTNDTTCSYSFDFGPYRRPEQLNSADKYRKALMENHSVVEYITSIDRVQESDNYIMATYVHAGMNFLVVYDKNSYKINSYTLDFVEKFYALRFGKIVGMEQNRIITYIPASSVVNMHRGYNEYNDFRIDFPKQVKRLQERFSQISEDDNPFIAIYKING